MPENITVAVDGGPASDAALRWVIDRGRSVDIQLEITSVAELDAAIASPDGAVGGHTEQVLTSALESVEAELPGIVVTTRIRHGKAHEELIHASRRADLLVIGTNKTSPIVGIMHGTLPLKVAGQSECTTVVVPFDWMPRGGAVVVGWVDDATAESALEFAAAEASRRTVPLTVVHTWHMPPVAPVDGAAAAVLIDKLVSSDHQVFADALRRVKVAHPELEVTERLEAGSAAVAIVRAAEAAGLAVVGSRGRGALAGFFLGSVSHDVLLNMPAPVAVIPHKREPIDVYPELVDEDL